MPTHQNRKLAAILFADIVNYTSLMQKNEQEALTKLNRFKSVLENKVPEFRGKIANFYGDGCLAVFDSSVDAINGAKASQMAFQEEPIVPVRIGLHSGGVVFEEGNAFGDAVNIASRVESLGIPGAVLLSSSVRNQIKNQPEFQLESLGRFEFKNVEDGMTVYALANEGFPIPKREEMQGKINSPKSKKQSIWKPIALVAVIALVLFAGYSWLNHKPTHLNSIAKNAIAIFPFDVKGSPDIQYLGEGMVDLISTKLDDMPTINSIDPNLIFSKVGKESQIARKLNEATELAKTFGANQFILGNIVEVDDLLRISATIYDASGNKIDAKIVEGNKKGELVKAVDELVKQLLAEEFEGKGDEMSSLGALTSNNLQSLKAYLKGEQAFRAGHYNEALDLFKEATDLDSTFAVAWMQYSAVGGWVDQSVYGIAATNWEKYKSTMPKKWQEYREAYKLYRVGDRKAIPAYEQLLKKYGENGAFFNGLGEYYFHFNHVYGKSVVEAKPYLEKTMEIDPHNMEAAIHLGDIALFENDSSATKKYLSKLSKDSHVYLRMLIFDLLLRDTVLVSDFQEIFDHPEYNPEFLYYFLQPVTSKPCNFQLAKRIMDFAQLPKEMIQSYKTLKYFVGGQEQLLEKEFEKLPDSVQLLAASAKATLIGDLNYLPFSKFYDKSYKLVKNQPAPQSIFAAIKYAIILEKPAEVGIHQSRLKALFENPDLATSAKYYYYSAKAFQAIVQKENDAALMYIDSAYLYPIGFWDIQNTCKDKLIMASSIYAEKGEYEKAIPYLANLRENNNLVLLGYATYRLSQYYEALGDIQNALMKCDLFLEIWKNCDEKYQPWLEDTKKRRDRLMAKMQ